MVRLSDDLAGICRAATSEGQTEERAQLAPPASYTTTQQPGSPASAMSSGKHRILLVDDDADVAEGLALLLRDVGHEVWVADNCDAAMEAACANLPEVILVDLGLPDKDGYEVAKLLREQCGMNRALLVALTGQGQEADPKRARKAGFSVHLTKPTTLAALEKVFSQAGTVQV
jgi:CheY-like chemotaxis protein